MRESLAASVRRIVTNWATAACRRARSRLPLRAALGRTLRCEPLEARRLLTATLTLSGTTLQYHYTSAALAPSIAGTDGALALTVSTGGGESLSIGAGIASSPITNGADVTIPAGVTTIEISSDSGSVPSIIIGTLNIGEGLQIDNSLPQAIFNGTVQAASLEADVQVQINASSITTTGAQTYNDFVGLNNSVHLAGTLLTTSAAGIGSDGVDVELTFSDPVTVESSFEGFNNFTSDGTGGTIIAGDFSTFLGQTYSNAVTVAADATLSSTGSAETGQTGGNITFNSTVDSASSSTSSLALDTTGTITTGEVGSVIPLQSLTTNGGETLISGDVTTIADQNYNDPVVQTANAHLTGSTLATGASWDAANFDLHLTFASGITVPGIFTDMNNFTCDGTGGTSVTADFATAGSQTYGNSVRQSATVLLSGVSFAATGAAWNAGGNNLQLSFTGNVTLATEFNDVGAVKVGSGAAIQQTAGGINAGSLSTNSQSGAILNGGNAINNFSAKNSSGDIQLNDGAAPLAIASIAEAGGSVQVVDYGAMRIDGAIDDTAPQGIVSLMERKTDLQETAKGVIDANMLIAQSKSGIALGGANAVSNFLAWNDPGPGDLLLDNTLPLTLQTIIESGGGTLTIVNADGIRITGTIDDPSGPVSLQEATAGIEELGGMIIATQLTTSAAGTSLNGSNFVGQFTANDNSSQGIQFNNSKPLQIDGLTESGAGSVQIINFGAGAVGQGTILAGDVSDPAGTFSLKEWNGDIEQAATFAITANTLVTQSKLGTTLAGANNAVGGLIGRNDGSGNFTLKNLPDLYVADIEDLLDPNQTGGNVELDEGGGLTLGSTGTIDAAGTLVLDVGQSGLSTSALAGAIQASSQVAVNGASGADALTVDLATAALPAAGIFFNGGAAGGSSSFTIRAKPLATASAPSTVDDFFVVHENSNTPADPGLVQNSLSSPSGVVFHFADVGNLSILGNQNAANEQDHANEFVGFYVGTGVNPLAKFTYDGGSGFNRMAVTGASQGDVIGVGDTNDPAVTSVAIPGATPNPVPLRFYVNSNDLAVLQLYGLGGGDTLVNASATAHALLDGIGGNNILWGGNGGLAGPSGQGITPAGVDILLGETGGADQFFGDAATNYLMSNYVLHDGAVLPTVGQPGQKPNDLYGLNGNTYCFPTAGDSVSDSATSGGTYNPLDGIQVSRSVYPAAGTVISTDPAATLAVIDQDPSLETIQPPF